MQFCVQQVQNPTPESYSIVPRSLIDQKGPIKQPQEPIVAAFQAPPNKSLLQTFEFVPIQPLKQA